MEKIVNEILKDNIKYTNVEKLGPKNKFLISEDGKTTCKWKHFVGFDIICNDCGKVCHVNSYITDYHVRNTYYCTSCRSKGNRNGMFGKHLSEEARQKISERQSGENNHFYGKHHTTESKKKLSESHKGKYDGEKNPMFGKNAWEIFEQKYGHEALLEKRKESSEKFKGEKNPFFGKHHTEETRKKISEFLKNSKEFHDRVVSTEYRKHLSEGLKRSEKMKKSRQSEEYKQKKRIQWEKDFKEGRRPRASYNPKACKVFDYIMERDGVHIEHALNGGEFLVEGLGYWLDGYDKKNNVAYEYDEKWHFVGGQLKESDIKRQKEIEEKLNCKFIRIKDGEYDEIIGN